MSNYIENEALGSDSSSSEFTRYLAVLSKRKWIVLIFFLAVIAAVIVYTKRQIPIYRAGAAVLIERSPPRVLTGTAEVLELGSTNYWSNKEYYQTQYNIIKSHEISLRVVKQNGIQFDERFSPTSSSHKAGEETAKPLSIDEIAEILSSRIEVVPVKDSMIVQILLEDADPEFAMSLVNWVAQAYRDYNLDHRQKAVAEADKELSELRNTAKIEYDEVTEKLGSFERQGKGGTIVSERKTLDEASLKGELELAQLRGESDGAAARLSTLRKYRKRRNIFLVTGPEMLNNPFIQQLKQEYVQLEKELEGLTTIYLEKHPSIRSVKKRMHVIEGKAQTEIKNVVQSAEMAVTRLVEREAKLQERLEEFRDRDLALAREQVQYDQIVVKRDRKREYFEKLDKRLTETKMTGEINVNNVSILDLARIPSVPVKPNFRLNLILGSLLGILGGIALAFFVDFMDNTVKGREEIERQIGLAYLGVVPTIREDRRTRRDKGEYLGRKELFVYHRPMSTVAEFSRSIRTNLLFVSPDRALRSLLITSPNPQEGKTTIAINIGINIAASGGRTVIVDTDMRRPRMHEAFELDAPSEGLSNYLIGSEPITRFIHETEVERLSILPCGPCPPNPSELLHTPKFTELIEELKQNYDSIIFDSPPVNLVTDALIIGNLVDGVVVIAKCGKTPKDALRHSKRQLEQVNARILGCVMNDLDLESRSYGYYYHQHGRYGYQYSENEEAAGPLA